MSSGNFPVQIIIQPKTLGDLFADLWRLSFSFSLSLFSSLFPYTHTFFFPSLCLYSTLTSKILIWSPQTPIFVFSTQGGHWALFVFLALLHRSYLQALMWSNCRSQLVYFLFFRNHDVLLPVLQCLKNNYFTQLDWSSTYLRQEDKLGPCYIILAQTESSKFFFSIYTENSIVCLVQ